MAISLKNYKQNIASSLLTKAKKNAVRECDESPKGNFVAFVDEGENSFDVNIELSEKGEVTKHECDCGLKIPFCNHKVALIDFLASNKSVSTLKIIKKKPTAIDLQFENISFEELKNWLKELLSKNKDLKLSFDNQFLQKNKVYTPDEVKKITENVYKVTCNSKVKIDLTQLKKLLSIWEETHKPIIENYYSNVSNEGGFLNFQSIIDTVIAIDNKVSIKTTKINDYAQSILANSVSHFSQIENHAAWEKSFGYFMNGIFDKEKIRLHYVTTLIEIANQSPQNRKDAVINSLVHHYKNFKTKFDSQAYTKILFNFLNSNNILKNRVLLFKTIKYDNDFNLELISKLIEYQEFNTARDYCKKAIDDNYQASYSAPYLKHLKIIYAVQKNDKELLNTMNLLLKLEFDFESYLYVSERMDKVEERKRWQTNLYNRAKNATRNGSENAFIFVFEVLDFEQKYSRMIEIINSYTPFALIIKYFQQMASINKEKFIEALFNISDSFFYSREQENKKYYTATYELMIKHFGKGFVMASYDKFTKKYTYSRSNFNRFVAEELKNNGI